MKKWQEREDPHPDLFAIGVTVAGLNKVRISDIHNTGVNLFTCVNE